MKEWVDVCLFACICYRQRIYFHLWHVSVFFPWSIACWVCKQVKWLVFCKVSMVMTQNCGALCVSVCVFMCASMHGAVSCESSAHLPTSPPPCSFFAIISSTAPNVVQWTVQCELTSSPPLFSPFSPSFLPFSMFYMSLKELKVYSCLSKSLAIKNTYTSLPCTFLLTLLAYQSI